MGGVSNSSPKTFLDTGWQIHADNIIVKSAICTHLPTTEVENRVQNQPGIFGELTKIHDKENVLLFLHCIQNSTGNCDTSFVK